MVPSNYERTLLPHVFCQSLAIREYIKFLMSVLLSYTTTWTFDLYAFVPFVVISGFICPLWWFTKSFINLSISLSLSFSFHFRELPKNEKCTTLPTKRGLILVSVPFMLKLCPPLPPLVSLHSDLSFDPLTFFDIESILIWKAQQKPSRGTLECIGAITLHELITRRDN